MDIVTVKAIDEATKNEKVMVLSGSLSKEEMTKMLIDAEENKIDDERFIQIANLREWLTSLNIQLLELMDTKVLSEEEVKELVDLKQSIEADYNSENIELLSSLVESGRELINFLTKKVHDQAKERIVMKSLAHIELKKFDDQLRLKYGRYIAGIDECGRGFFSWTISCCLCCVR